MELCVSMWSVHRKFYHENWTTIDFLRFCRDIDVRRVELLDLFWRDAAEEVPDVLRFIRENDMEVAAYAVANDFVQADAAKRADALASVRRGLDFARQFHAPVVRVFAGNLKEGYDFESAFLYIVEGLKAAVEGIEPEITLALENHGLLAGRGEQIKRVIREVGSSRLRSTFDVGNFYLVGQQPMEALAELSGVLSHIHVKDFVKSEAGLRATTGEYFSGVTCGEGIVPFPDILSMLKVIDYSGTLSIEYEGDGDELDGVRQSLAFLRNLLNESVPV
ncbi:sugar phosphate isomerase/epimerase family protein [Alicyclobacillus fodiniaquatilis]|uniref:Sugar phosphate isomerase/epimerase family protein n=1 Tax=Alicyclobacillus fodiniaquatilis TaxID=1661150 RepID=A0ABW4JDW7_9BACL